MAARSSFFFCLARALLFNGLANAFKVAAPNRRPPYRADIRQRYDFYAWSKVLEKTPLSRRADLGALRIRTAGDHPIGAMESSRVLHLMPKVRQTGAFAAAPSSAAITVSR